MRSARLVEVARMTPRTRRLTVALDASPDPFAFAAGQAVFVRLTGSRQRAAYSIASPPSLAANNRLELLVPAEGAFGHPGLEPASVTGALLELEGPMGSLRAPAATSRAGLLLVAGGTGIAPLRSIVLDQLDRQVGTPLTLVYSVRSPDEFAFAEEFAALERQGRLSLYTTVSRDDRLQGSTARSGRVDDTLLRSALPGDGAWCLVCGPNGFVDAVTITLMSLGVPRDRVVVEG